MRINKRTLIVDSARIKLAEAVNSLVEEFELTEIETLQLLNQSMAVTLKYMLREERHPDNSDRPADEE